VLDLLQRGMASKSIAHRLNMSTSTVKVHVHNIMAKLDVDNRTAAAVAARYMPSSAPSDKDDGAGHGVAVRPMLESASDNVRRGRSGDEIAPSTHAAVCNSHCSAAVQSNLG
jgi:Bacterial regulatory proteins, luxR family